MGNFIVSARKYRPQTFGELVGQEHIGFTLRNAIRSNQLAHAFLFCGPRGIGKTTSARILAKVINCENVTSDTEPCNECESCKSFNEGSSMNIIELDAASNNSVENIRKLIEQVRILPQLGKYKVFIIDEVHMLSASAFNAFLKTLEEPPPHVKFILATTEKHKIIPTILSRCQIFDFKRIGVEDTVLHLKNICKNEGVTAEDEALQVIAQKADGALRDALSIFDRIASFSNKEITYAGVLKNLNVLDYDYFFKIIDFLMIEDSSGIILLFDEILRKGFDPEQLIHGLSQHIRDILMCKDERTLKLLEVTGNLKNKYFEQSQKVKKSLLLTSLDILNHCDVNYPLAQNKRLHVEIALIKMSYILRSVENLNSLGEELKKKDNSNIISSTENKFIDRKEEKPKAVAEQKTVAPVKQKIEDKQEIPKPISTKSLGKVGKKILSLSDMEDEFIESEKKEEERKEFSHEALINFWTEYIENFKGQPSVYSILKKAKESIKIKDKTIFVEVPSNIGKDFLSEANMLIKVREHFKDFEILFEITVNKKITDDKPKKKTLSEKEKYELLKKKNSNLAKIQKAFDLKISNV